MNLLELPDDILVEIFRRLDADSLYTCLLVNKTLRDCLRYHRELEYQYRLEKQQLISTGHGDGTYEERIGMLKWFTHLWWYENTRREATNVYDIDGGCIAYELVAGVFAKTDGSSLTLQWIVSLTTPPKQVVLTQREIGFSIKDFALDPTQDLIVFIEADSGVRPPTGREMTLHFRTLSTCKPHPLAKQPTLRFTIPDRPDLSAVAIQLADDLLTIFLTNRPTIPRLFLFDWRTGTMIHNTAAPGKALPEGSEWFEILSPRSYAIFSIANGGSINIYNITYPYHPNPNPNSHTTTTTTTSTTATLLEPTCVAHLLLPPLLPEVQLLQLSSHTGPYLSKPRNDGIFTTKENARVFVVYLRIANSTRTHATLFIHGEAFEPYMKMGVRSEEAKEGEEKEREGERQRQREKREGEGEGEGEEVMKVPFREWSYRKTFVTPFHLSTNWLRYVQGTKVVMYMNPEDGLVGIFDFNLERAAGIRQQLECDPSHFQIFAEEIKHCLPSRRRTLHVKTKCTSFMADEDYILGLDTVGNFEERITSLEVFSMYHAPEVEALQSD